MTIIKLKKYSFKRSNRINYSFNIITIILFIIFLSTQPLHAFWNNNYIEDNANNLFINIGTFNKLYNFDCNYADIVINDEFRDKYMTLDNNNNYTWKLDNNGDIMYRKEINSLTPYGSIIKSNNCYMVIVNNYSLINTGIPDTSDNTWLNLKPLSIHYIPNFWYAKNHIVKTTDNNYYMAKWETNTNPNISRNAWNKIEPVSSFNFNSLERYSNFIDYANPILSTIIPSLIWDNYTIYNEGDIAYYENIKYVSVKSSSNAIPSQNPWAWRQV